MKDRFPTRFYIGAILCLATAGRLPGQEDSRQYSLADTVVANRQYVEAAGLMARNKFDSCMWKIDSALHIYKSTDMGMHEKALSLSFLKAHCHYHLGDFSSAIKLGEETLARRMEVLDENHEDMAKSHNNLGIYYRKNKDFAKALAHGRAALNIRIRNHGEENAQVAKSYGNISSVFTDMSEFDSALYYLRKSLDTYKQVLPAGDPQLGISLSGIGLIYHRKGDLAMAEKTYLESMALQRDAAGGFNASAEWALNNLGVVYTDMGNYREAARFHKHALALREKIYGENNYLVGVSLRNLGFNCIRSYDLIPGKKYLERSLQVLKASLGERHLHLADVYNDLGAYYTQIEDSEKGRGYFQKAIEIQLGKYGEHHKDIAFPLYNIGMSYLMEKKFSESVSYVEKAIGVHAKCLHPDTVALAESYLGLGLICTDMKDFGKAEECIETAIGLFLKKLPPDHPSLAACYNNMGNLLNSMDKPAEAIGFLEKSLPMKSKESRQSHLPLATTYSNLGKSYMKMNQPALADSLFKSALAASHFYNPDYDASIEPLALQTATVSRYNAFNKKMYGETSAAEYLHNIHLHSKKVLDSYEVASRKLSQTGKGSFNETLKAVYADAASSCLLLHALSDSLHYLAQSFSYAERSRSRLLLEAIQEAGAMDIAGIPDSLLRREHELRVDMAYFDKKRQESLPGDVSGTDSSLLSLSARLFDLNREQEELKARFELDYPQYYAARYDLASISLSEVQKELLRPGQSLLEYLVSDSSVLVFLIRPDTIVAREIRLDFPLEAWVRDMTTQGIYGCHSLSGTNPLRTNQWNTACTENYTRSPHQLYEKLVAPVAGHITEELIVIPDGPLGYLPFEALLTAKPPEGAVGRFSNYAFMLRKHQVSYCYSATLLREFRQRRHREQPAGGLLAVAPFYREDAGKFAEHARSPGGLVRSDTLSTLAASGEEVALVARMMKGESWSGSQASQEKFRQEAGRYRILHLATHARAEDRSGDYAFLAFGVPGDTAAFSKLYARDLYNFSLNADMVVLSACETGTGELKKGEGIVSLARAFSYAGAKSIFATLWRVSDAKTAALAGMFYRNLLKGMSKDAALRVAKLEYLGDSKGEAGHPYFWAGIIGIGDMRALW